MVKGRGGHLGKMIIDSPLLAVQAAVPIHELVPILAPVHADEFNCQVHYQVECEHIRHDESQQRHLGKMIIDSPVLPMQALSPLQDSSPRTPDEE